jgi:hypothetical protein
MKELVFLLEERSMMETLQVLTLPLMPSGMQCRFIPHNGISDLEKSIPRKLRGWINPDARFVVVRDKHSSNCRTVKQRLIALCKDGHRPETLVRIVCHELESWFLGDLAAVEKAYRLRGIAKRQDQAKYRSPDQLPNAVQELRRLAPQYQKLAGSRLIAPHMSLDTNKSHSFHVLIDGIRRFIENDPKQP